MAAVYSGSSDIVLELLEEGADPNAESKDHGIPLEKATSIGRVNKEIVSHLLSFKVKADLKYRHNAFHILHRAALYDMVDLAEYCLDNDCKIDMVTTEGPWYSRRFGDFPHEMTPLAYACAEGHARMMELLLRRGAPFEQNKQHSALLWTAAHQGHADAVALLIRHFKAKHSSEEVARFFEQRPSPWSGHPILFAAVSSGKANVVRTLLDQGVRYESNWFDSTPLLATATFGCPEVTEVLLEYDKKNKIDVCINQRAKHGRTALFEACANNQLKVAKLLLEAEADYWIGDNDKATALHVAAHQDSSDLVALLVEKASEDPETFHKFLNIRDASGRTALMETAERHRLSSLNLLLDHGADCTDHENKGNTPLHYAIRSGFDNLVEALLKRAKATYVNKLYHFEEFLNRQNNEGKTALWESAERNQESTVQLLLKHGADYSIPGDRSITALHVSSHEGYMDVVSLLLRETSTDPDEQLYREFLDRRNEFGKTALIDAAETNRPDTIALLLKYGADYSIGDNDHFTALHWCTYRNHAASVRCLLETVYQDKTDNGEKFKRFLNQQGKRNRASALCDAACQGLTDLAKFLLSYGADYDCFDSCKRSPLHHAIERAHTNMAIAIIDRAKRDGNRERLKSLLEVRDDSGDNVWDKAKKRKNERVLGALRECGVEIKGM